MIVKLFLIVKLTSEDVHAIGCGARRLLHSKKPNRKYRIGYKLSGSVQLPRLGLISYTCETKNDYLDF